MTLDKNLEDLLRSIFRVPEKRAKEVSEILTLAKFQENFDRLEGILDFDTIFEVVKHGSFLDYTNSQFEEYLHLARTVYNRIEKDAKSLGILVTISPKFFYSIESLKAFLGIEIEDKIEIPPSKLENLNVGKYKILHKGDEKSREYLKSLIESGYVVVGRHDHWHKSKHKGARGRHILEEISFQLILLFNELGLSRPQYELMYGQSQLMVYGKTRELLREIRDKVYQLQNKI
ncbi:hypothetical protein HYX03_02095 [Candidatus Woesearchaeota archaeon]|nr:hypothetical protein [Candidatus Woesearchaeota archaeon]